MRGIFATARLLGLLAVMACSLVASPSSAQDLGLGFGRLVSPGDLAESHHKWDSIKSCGDCHNLTGGVNNAKCLDCHKELRARIEGNRGFHAHPSVKAKECKSCHRDHKGRGYAMVAWENGRERFDHRLTGWDLKEKHARTKCEKCHDRKTGAGKETFLGLSMACGSCHKDVHEKTLGDQCADCHLNANSFRSQDVRFDHAARARYPLDGKHARVTCAKCHPGVSKDRAVFKVEGRDQCVTCHRKDDKHKGSLGDKCESCHVAADWKETRFDHSKARFPLKGLHAKERCVECHPDAKTGRYKVAEYNTCSASGCHDAESRGAVHGDQFKGRKCSECHTEEGWNRPVFSHDRQSKFRLDGRHAQVKCGECHKAERGVTVRYEGTKQRTVYKPIRHDSCAAAGCHDRASKSGMAHRDQFGNRPCSECHTVAGWKEKKLFDHSKARYRLEGKHAQVRCDDCHTRVNGATHYRPIETGRCSGSGCHDTAARGDIHDGQFKSRDCGDCHTLSGWKPIRFVHDRNSDFKLDGKHKEVKCGNCHAPVPGATVTYEGRARAVDHYRPIAHDNCSSAGCHNKDPHKGSFMPKTCKDCHVVEGWKDMRAFDHTLNTSYPLTGKHKVARCDRCHPAGSDKMLVFKPVKSGCYDCHQRVDELKGHKGAMGRLCGDCHTTATWSPKVVAHDQTGFPLMQTHAQLRCSECHTKGGGDFSGLSPDCQQCHTDSHLNQFGRLCNDCHTMRNWEPTKFKHVMTGFRLEGAHRFLNCADCHKDRIYRGFTDECSQCHLKDFGRGGIFHKSGNTNCVECHRVYTFKPAIPSAYSKALQ